MFTWIKIGCWKKFMTNVPAYTFHESYLNEQVETNVAFLTSVQMKIKTVCTLA